MSSSSFKPAALPPDSWKGWLRNGWQLFARGCPSFMPLQGMLMVMICLCQQYFPLKGAVLITIMVLYPVFNGLQFSAAESLAKSRRVDVGEMLGILIHELSEYRDWYKRQIIAHVVIICLMLIAINAFSPGASSEPLNPETGKALSSLAAATHPLLREVWIFFLPLHFLWLSTFLTSVSINTFFFPLGTRCKLPWREAEALSTEGFFKNSRALHVVAFMELGFILLTLGFPILIIPAWFIFTCIRFCSWREIFLGKGKNEQQEVVIEKTSIGNEQPA